MIQIDMPMPEKCGYCPCFHYENPIYCQAVKADKNKKIVNPYGSLRPEWCPLKEQDELLKHEYWRGYNNGRADERGLQEGTIMQTFSPD